MNLQKVLGMERCNPVDSPFVENATVEPGDLELLSSADAAKFSTCVGIAQYLTFERCDILYAVKELGRCTRWPCVGNMVQLKRLVRYLSGTKGYCIVLKKTVGGARVLRIACESNWA